MLDNLDLVAQVDKSNGLALIAGQAAQLSHNFEFAGLELGEVRNVVVAGMGGSNLATEFLLNWKREELKLPLVPSREYTLPAFVNEHTLVVASSYSGNTEETLSCLDEALERGAHVVIMTSGGKLHELAASKQIPELLIPGGLQPRLSLLYQIKAMATLFETAGWAKGWVHELEAAATWLADQAKQWVVAVPTEDNPAKRLAGALYGKVPVIYAGPTLEFAARNMKIALNENAKNVAFWYALPEFDHNEFQGWAHPAAPPMAVVELESTLEDEAVKQRFSISNRLLSGTMPKPHIVHAQGKTQLEQLVWCVLFGGMVSGYVAVLNREDPLPVERVEKLKAELAKEAHGTD